MSDCTVILFIPHQLFPNRLLIRKDMATTDFQTHTREHTLREGGREKVTRKLSQSQPCRKRGRTGPSLSFSFKSLPSLFLSTVKWTLCKKIKEEVPPPTFCPSALLPSHPPSPAIVPFIYLIPSFSPSLCSSSSPIPTKQAHRFEDHLLLLSVHVWETHKHTLECRDYFS